MLHLLEMFFAGVYTLSPNLSNNSWVVSVYFLIKNNFYLESLHMYIYISICKNTQLMVSYRKIHPLALNKYENAPRLTFYWDLSPVSKPSSAHSFFTTIEWSSAFCFFSCPVRYSYSLSVLLLSFILHLVYLRILEEK